MNKHIELIKKWLAEPESVSLEELKANREAAWAAAFDCAAEAAKAAYWAADAAVEAAKADIYWAADVTADADDAAYWAAKAAGETVYWGNLTITYIKEYEELTK